MHLFIYSNLDDTSKDYLRQQLSAGPAGEPLTLIFRNELPAVPADQPPARFQSADAVLGNPPPAWFAQPLPNLKFWQLDSAGFDGYARVQTNAQVANMGDFFAWPCAETIVGGILAVYRQLPRLAVLQSRQEWQGVPVRPQTALLRHKRVLVLGTGTIGRAVRQMLLGFECRVTMMARTDPQADLHTVDELTAVLPQIDVVINCLPGTATNFVSADLIAAMQPGSLYANVGRGSTTDEPALIAALQRGHLGGAVLDVTATEPLPADSPLWTLPNVLLTQHTGGGRPDEDRGKVDQFVQHLRNFLSGQPVQNVVALERGY